MNLQSSQRLAFEPLRSLDYTLISGSYALIGTPFANPVRQLLLQNLTDANMIVSFDGVDDHVVVAASSGIIFDFCSNKNDTAGNLEQPAYTFCYVRQESAAPTKGVFYVALTYASQV